MHFSKLSSASMIYIYIYIYIYIGNTRCSGAFTHGQLGTCQGPLGILEIRGPELKFESPMKRYWVSSPA